LTTQRPNHPSTQPPIDPSTQPPNDPSTHRPNNPIHPHTLTHPHTHSPTHSLTHTLAHPPIHPSTHPPIHPSTHPPARFQHPANWVLSRHDDIHYLYLLFCAHLAGWRLCHCCYSRRELRHSAFTALCGRVGRERSICHSRAGLQTVAKCRAHCGRGPGSLGLFRGSDRQATTHHGFQPRARSNHGGGTKHWRRHPKPFTLVSRVERQLELPGC